MEVIEFAIGRTGGSLMSRDLHTMIRHSRRILTFGLFLSFLSLAPSAFAQAVYGSIAGTVKDSSGATVPGATVTVTSVERKTVDTVVSNESGFYVKDRLLPGVYEVKAELSNFKAAVLRDVRVSIDTQTRIDFELQLGQLSEEVVVTGGSPLLKTDRADVSTNFDSKQITDLPVLDRNFTKFILLTPGTQQLQWQHAASENPQGSTQTMVNGQHFSGTGYQLDGTENRDPILGIIVINPTLESIGETKITSQNYDAEFGQATAGVVSVQTKSGRNQWFGSAFEFYQGDNFQARNPFTQFQADPVTGKFLPETKKNQFGGSLGGKIVANKVFFFGDYQGTRSTVGGTRLLTVPTAAARSGDLSAFGINIFDPATGVPAVRQQFTGNVIPTGRLSPEAQRILALVPMPNAPGRDGGTRENYQASGSEEFEENSFNVRLDGRIGDSTNMFGRYSVGDFFRDGPTSFGTRGRAGARDAGGHLGREEPESCDRPRSRDLADAVGRLPIRLVQVQGRRPAVRLRHDAGRRRGHSRAQRFGVRLGAVCRLHRRGPRLQHWFGPGCQPLQLPAGSG